MALRKKKEACYRSAFTAEMEPVNFAALNIHRYTIRVTIHDRRVVEKLVETIKRVLPVMCRGFVQEVVITSIGDGRKEERITILVYCDKKDDALKVFNAICGVT